MDDKVVAPDGPLEYTHLVTSQMLETRLGALAAEFRRELQQVRSSLLQEVNADSSKVMHDGSQNSTSAAPSAERKDPQSKEPPRRWSQRLGNLAETVGLNRGGRLRGYGREVSWEEGSANDAVGEVVLPFETKPLLALFSAVPEVETPQGPQQALAVATLEVGLKDDFKLVHHLERTSMYGVSLAIPQIARSAGWPPLLLALCIRTYLFLILNYALVAILLYMVQKEENVMDRFAGQMNLCDFGAFVGAYSGPGGANASGCLGPMGSKISPDRIYSWHQWSLRHFVQESMISVFPDRKSEITSRVDPGEYGVEDYRCRLLCCFIFVLEVVKEIEAFWQLLQLLKALPTDAQPWIRYSGANSQLAKDSYKLTLDDVTVVVAGMSWRWKVLNLLVLVLPRLALCKLTVEAGITFLMETATIDDAIVNAVALAFILNVPVAIQEAFTSHETKTLMGKLHDFEFPAAVYSASGVKEMMKEELSRTKCVLLRFLIPWRLMLACALTALVVMSYYWSHCIRDASGHWISKAVYSPTSVRYDFLKAVFPLLFPDEAHQSDPYWDPAMLQKN